MLIGSPVYMDIAPPEMALFPSGGGGIGGIFGADLPQSPRAVPHIQLIMEEMESVLDALIIPYSPGYLEFLRAEPIPIDIANRRPEEEPNVSFKRYHITLYPESDVFDEEPRIGGRVNRYYRIGIALFRKVPKRARGRMFSDENDYTAGVGIFEFANFVMDALRNNTLGSLINMTAGKQFETELQDTGEDLQERIDITHSSEMLHTIDVDGVP